MKRITILLAEDHALVREGIRALLESEEDMLIVGEAGNGLEAVEMARTRAPQIILLDLAMPLLNGLETMQQIGQMARHTKIIVLSAHNDDAYRQRALEFGAAGYLLKQSGANLLIRTIREVAGHDSPTAAKVRSSSRDLKGNKGSHSHPAPSPLTPREREVLQFVAEGKANKEMAILMDLSVKTVEKHRQSLMQKLHIHDTAGLTRHAIASGVIECSNITLPAPPSPPLDDEGSQMGA
jgi:DNA-binding NarL/FixJ family response regulator